MKIDYSITSNFPYISIQGKQDSEHGMLSIFQLNQKITLQRVMWSSISTIWLPFDLIRISWQILNFWWHACRIYWLKKLQFLDDSRENRMSRTRNISRIRENDIFSEYFYWPIWKNLFSTSYGFTWICLKNWWERNVDLNVAEIYWNSVLTWFLWTINTWNVYKINIYYIYFTHNRYENWFDWKKKIIFSQSNNSLNIKYNRFTFDL